MLALGHPGQVGGAGRIPGAAVVLGVVAEAVAGGQRGAGYFGVAPEVIAHAEERGRRLVGGQLR